MTAKKADRISNLPVRILYLILSHLPIRDIVRTSVLSKTWRHKWAEVPVLAFDKKCRPASSKTFLNESKALVSIIDNVLLLHTGTLEVFKLEGIGALTDINRWILNVSRKSVKEFVLCVQGFEKYNLPTSLYDCSNLVKLRLSNCSLKRPSYSMRLERLKCLYLWNVAFTEDAFDVLVSSCPSLENLTLTTYPHLLDNLRIKAPNLRSINLFAPFSNITFGCTLVKLSDVSIKLGLEPDMIGPSVFVESGLSEFFTNLPGIQRLEVAGSFVKCLAFGSIPKSMPFQLKDLHHINISIDFRATKDCLAALCLLNSSPNLTELMLNSKAWDTYDPADPGEWRDGSIHNWKFEKLRTVEIFDGLGTTAELKFMEFLLANSPVLEKMTITPCQETGFDFVSSMLRFKRASSEAEIIFDPSQAQYVV